jgi:hypothetical protein
MISDTSQTTPNILRILPEAFLALSSLFSNYSNESKNFFSFVEPLSLFPYGLRTTQA